MFDDLGEEPHELGVELGTGEPADLVDCRLDGPGSSGELEWLRRSPFVALSFAPTIGGR